jgi:transcriptional regulator with GAF, ATPase, and Fis domain
MIESGSSRDVPSESSSPIGVAPLESIVCTQELRNRPLRSPEYEKETRALVALASALAESPRTILQTLAETILDVTQSDSAGVSLLTTDDGGKRFYWPAIAGTWKPYIGGGTPRDFGPCGDVLDRNIPLLFRHLEQRYTYFQPVTPPPAESLLVPFHVGGKAVGTVWAVAHGNRRKFDAEDLRLLESMSRFASAAYQAVESIETLKLEVAAREKAETALQELTDGLEIQVRIRTEELEQRNKEIKQLQEQLFKENIVLRQEIDKTSMFEEIVGSSEALRKVLLQVAKVASTHSTVLITGETGTGKELVARAIHKRSPRSSCAFVSVNCAGIPSSLMASELFGHEKGAFTGAVQRRQGRFELADGGTIFLDEIGELSIETQVMLLRVLQEHEFERVGRSGPIRTDVRVIAATNRDLEVAIADGTFRADLFYRLNVFPLGVPALRERRMDIPLLVEYFIHRYAKRAGKRIRGISQEALTLLQSYDWPGNIRELQNVIERAVILSDSNTLSIDKQWFSGRPLRPPAVSGAHTGELATVEREAVKVALRQSKGRVAGPFGAATRLGVPPSTLESKIKALKLDKRLYKSE